MTPAGIEPATFRFVAQHLNHCATAVPTRIKKITSRYFSQNDIIWGAQMFQNSCIQLKIRGVIMAIQIKVLYLWATNIWRHCTKSSRPEDLTPGICAPLRL